MDAVPVSAGTWRPQHPPQTTCRRSSSPVLRTGRRNCFARGNGGPPSANRTASTRRTGRHSSGGHHAAICTNTMDVVTASQKATTTQGQHSSYDNPHPELWFPTIAAPIRQGLFTAQSISCYLSLGMLPHLSRPVPTDKCPLPRLVG